jgi:hypothetical protein
MVNKKVLLCLAAAVAVGLGTVALVGGTDVLSLNGAAPTYTLTLDGSNGAITGAYSTDILVNSDAQTTSGKSFRVSYYNAMASSNATYKYAQLKSGSNVGGYLYSTDGVSGLKTITVTFSATKAPSLYLSDTVDFSSSTAISLTSGTAVTATKNFFKIHANGSAAYIGSIVLTYDCSGILPASSSSASASSVSSSASSSSGSSSAVSGAKYQLVTAQSGIVAGTKYLIGGAASGTTGFCGTSTISNTNTSTNVTHNYRSAVSATIDSSSIVTVSNAIDEFTLGGDATNGYTFYSNKSAGNGYLCFNTAVTPAGGLDLGSDASVTGAKWAITIASTGAATVINNVTSDSGSRYLEYYEKYSEYSTYVSSTAVNVYLFVAVAA